VDVRRINPKPSSLRVASEAGAGLTRTEGEKWQVTSGDYNKALDTKIAEIKTTCNIP